METNFKGALAEQKVIMRCLEKGLLVSKPVVETRYDLVIDDRGKLYRVQVKYGDGKSQHSEGAVVVPLTSWDHNGEGHRSAKQTRTYNSSEVDAVIVYLPKTDSCVWLGPELFDNKSTIQLRYEPPKNNQKKGIHLVENLEW